VVPIQVAGAVLALTVNGFVKVFHDRGTSRFRSAVVRVHIGDEHGERLGTISKLGWGLLAGLCGMQHYPGVMSIATNQPILPLILRIDHQLRATPLLV
jgi:hypothetical protein